MRNILLAACIATSALMLAACGKSDAPQTAESSAPAAAPAAPAPAENVVGKSLYGKHCALCHAAGMAGAPKPGDKAEWGPRIAQGADTLYQHAVEGFTGAKGVMPARGGTSLGDEEVKAVVDYMVGQSK